MEKEKNVFKKIFDKISGKEKRELMHRQETNFMEEKYVKEMQRQANLNAPSASKILEKYNEQKEAHKSVDEKLKEVSELVKERDELKPMYQKAQENRYQEDLNKLNSFFNDMVKVLSYCQENNIVVFTETKDNRLIIDEEKIQISPKKEVQDEEERLVIRRDENNNYQLSGYNHEMELRMYFDAEKPITIDHIQKASEFPPKNYSLYNYQILKRDINNIIEKTFEAIETSLRKQTQSMQYFVNEYSKNKQINMNATKENIESEDIILNR